MNSDELNAERMILRIREYLSGGTETAVGAWFADKNALRLQKERGEERGEELIKNAQEIQALEAQIAALQEQMKQHAEASMRLVAEAREEEREACARYVEATGFVGMTCELIRATPLDSTPLAARIAELEATHISTEDLAEAARQDGEKDQRIAELESALAAEVERHQATAKVLDEQAAAWDSLKVAGMDVSVKIFAATCAKTIRDFLASLPAGPREDR